MARHNLRELVRYLRQLAGSSGASGASDAELLERYVHCRDEAAFELLLWRHGALVFNVCRRLLPSEQDAEDAFQATFLTFARKAGSIGRGGSVAAWLYKVAYRVALKAKERMRKTAAAEEAGGEAQAVASADDPLWSDVRPILDEELNRLPEHLRRPIVLCYLEGKSNAEAARELGCRLGTIYSRLSRGRELMRQRLQYRGMTLPAAALTAVLTARAVEAAPAISLVRTAARAALAFADPSAAVAVSPCVAELAEGVLRAMFVTKLKIAAVMLLVIGVAAGGLWTQAHTAAPRAEAKAEAPPPKPAGGDKKNAEPIRVRVVKPKKGKLPQIFQQWTAIDVAQRQQLVPLVSGTIKVVAVEVGDQVEKGQPLITLDAPLVAKEVDEAEATLEMACIKVEEAKAAIDVAETETPGGGSPSKAKVKRARVTLKGAEVNVKLARITLDKARIQESFTRLRAEFDGVVAERNCDAGNFVQGGASGAQKPLLTLVRVDHLRAVVRLNSFFAGIAERSDPVELSVKEFEDTKGIFPGKIVGINPILEPNGVRAVTIDMANPKNRLVPGQHIGIRIRFNETRVPETLMVPTQCLISPSPGELCVVVARDGKAHRTPIKMRAGDDKNVEITEGIEASDLVITNPAKLEDGAPVKIEKAP